jgi:hypothetical protein
VEFKSSLDFKPTFFGDPRAVSGLVEVDDAGVGFKVSASKAGVDMLAPQLPVPGLAGMLEGLEVTMSYGEPSDTPDWLAARQVATSSAEYAWNAKCKDGVNFENCISSNYREVMGKDSALEFCIDYCFADAMPAKLTPLEFPVVTLEPTPVPTTWMPTPLPTPHPTQIYTQPCLTCPTPKPTPLPTFLPTPIPTALPTTMYPTFMPTPIPTVAPTLKPTPYPTFVPTPIPTAVATTPYPTPKPTTPFPTPCVPSYLPTPLPTPFPTVMPTVYPTPAPTVTLLPTPQPTQMLMPKCLVCFHDTGNMVDFFASRLSACQEAIARMDLCMYSSAADTQCEEEELISYKKMVLVFCSEPGSEESLLAETGNIAIKPTMTCAQGGTAVLDPVHGVAPPSSAGHVLASDCTAPARRLGDKILFNVSDGATTFGVSSIDYSDEKDALGLKSMTVELTGPNPAFEVDAHIEFDEVKAPTGIVFPKPFNDYWLNTDLLWKIGVVPKVAEALAAAKSPDGGKAVEMTRRLTASTLGDFEKANIAMHVLKVSQNGIHHMILKERTQMSWVALAGYSSCAVLLVALALGACRGFFMKTKGYTTMVAPEEDDEMQSLGLHQ